MASALKTFIVFCEPAYARLPIIAELWNTLSSFAYCLPALYFWNLTDKYRKALPECFPENVVLQCKLCAIAWFILGLGSAAFHAFQTVWAELWDELGMLVAILTISFCLFDLHPLTTGKRALRFYGLLILLVVAASLVYIQIMYHPFFAMTFLVASLVPAFLLVTLPMNMNRGRIKYYHESPKGSSKIPDAGREAVLKVSSALSPFGSLGMNKAVLCGISLSLLGYSVWHVDQKCVHEKWDATIPRFYELDWYHWAHPFWHFSTAVASLFFFDAMLKVRVEAYLSPLSRRPETGSFISMFSFNSSLQLLLGIREEKN